MLQVIGDRNVYGSRVSVIHNSVPFWRISVFWHGREVLEPVPRMCGGKKIHILKAASRCLGLERSSVVCNILRPFLYGEESIGDWV